MQLRNPDNPATDRQLYKLHQLTGEDTREWELTMAQASDRISALEVGIEVQQQSQWQPIPQEWEEYLKNPMSYADVRLFFGDQRSGKSISAVACVIDDYYKYATHAVSPEGEVLKVRALNEMEQKYLQASVKSGGMGIRYDHLRHMRVFNDDGTRSKIAEIPQEFTVLSPVKVFANRTLYGIRYVPFDVVKFLSYINTDLMTAGWFILSESVLINKKDTMSNMGRFMEWFGAECGKRHLRMIVDMQYRRMLQSIFHLYATTTVECTYDSETTRVYLEVNNSSPEMQTGDYISYPYRRFFNTDELMAIPQHRIDRAIAGIVGQ